MSVRKMSVLLCLVLVMLALLPASVNSSDNGMSSISTFVKEMIVRAHQKLTTGLYKAFARQNSGNLLLSPWSVMSLLTVTYLVAGGRTASEIGDHLRINLLRRKEILAGFEDINDMFQTAGNGSAEMLSSVNGALVGRTVNPKLRLRNVLQQNLNTYIDHIIAPDDDDNHSHDNAAGTTREAFQKLLMEKTQGQIQNLLPLDTGLPSKISLWLFNLMYFQGTWKAPFSPYNTHQGRFLVKGKTPANVPTMLSKASYPRSYYPELKTTLLEMPYGHAGRYGLFILLPDEVTGLARLEKRLRHFSLESMLSDSHWVRRTKVYLPKFKFQTNVQLTDVMKKLGFKRMFSPKEADFSRLNPKKGGNRKSPYVSKMVHRAVIEVNENGTTAAAATALKMSTRRYVPSFRVDHPFMFVLRDKQMGINLFVGRVTDPRKLS